MLIEVGKTYINRAGSICKVLSRTDPSLQIGSDSYFSYFPLEDGREAREQSFQVDKYGSHLSEDNQMDLIMEYKMPDLQWVWCRPDKDGLWSYGGDREKTSPVFTGVDIVRDCTTTTKPRLNCWRCYLGPIPQISQPKKLVKQTLWMIKYYTKGVWEELWLPDEETPRFQSFHDVGHKTTTTRHV